MYRLVLALVLLVASCSKQSSAPKLEKTKAPGAALTPSALEAIRAGNFQKAKSESETILKEDSTHARARVLRAIARYHFIAEEFFTELEKVDESVTGMLSAQGAIRKATDALAEVEKDLAVAAQDPEFFLELCLACWEQDWNRNGEIDERDRLLLQIEVDAQGNEYPPGAAERKPTFRFDHGDIYWARAAISFQRAIGELLLAYEWSTIPMQLELMGAGPNSVLTVPLKSREGVSKARDFIMQGLAHSGASRKAYLAETDDDREWVPSPKQKSHPVPLPMDDTLYETWKGVLADVEDLLAGRTGLRAADVALLAEHEWKTPPKGYLDFGAMFSEPKDIQIQLKDAVAALDAEDADRALKLVFGNYYKEDMKASPLTERLLRMKRDLESGSDSLDRKLRYLFWVN